MQVADLNAGMPIGCIVDEFAVPKIHSRMADLCCTRTEKQQVSRPEGFAFHRDRAVPGGLHFRIPRHLDSTMPNQHLGKSGAVEAEAADSSPCVGDAEKPACQPKGIVH